MSPWISPLAHKRYKKAYETRWAQGIITDFYGIHVTTIANQYRFQKVSSREGYFYDHSGHIGGLELQILR